MGLFHFFDCSKYFIIVMQLFFVYIQYAFWTWFEVVNVSEHIIVMSKGKSNDTYSDTNTSSTATRTTCNFSEHGKQASHYPTTTLPTDLAFFNCYYTNHIVLLSSNHLLLHLHPLPPQVCYRGLNRPRWRRWASMRSQLRVLLYRPSLYSMQTTSLSHNK